MIIYTYDAINDKVIKKQDTREILIGTVVFGLFTYFAASALKFSIPELLFNSLQESDTFSIKVLLGSLISTAIGGLLSWYITSRLEKDSVIGFRIIILFLTLMTLLFGDVYIQLYSIPNEKG
jgi:hypothetical protein